MSTYYIGYAFGGLSTLILYCASFDILLSAAMVFVAGIILGFVYTKLD